MGLASSPEPLSPLLKPLLSSPELPRHIRALQQRWDAEQIRRSDFRDRVAADQKQEFINGEIVMHSPARAAHNFIVAKLVTIFQIIASKQFVGSKVMAEKAMIDCGRNDYEPDVFWYGPEKAASISPDQTIFPPPDLVVEVLSDSTASRDRGIKLQDYALNGIAEYWIIDPDTQVVEQYQLIAGEKVYAPAETGTTVQCHVVPGLQFPARALFDDGLFSGVLMDLTAQP